MSEPKQTNSTGKYAHGGSDKSFFRRPGGIATLAVGTVLVLLLAVCGVFVYGYQGIYPGISVQGIDLGKMSQQQAQAALEGKLAGQEEQLGQLVIAVNGEEHQLDVSDMGATYNLAQTAENAYNYGREGNPFHRIGQIAGSVFGGQEIEVAIEADESRVMAKMDDVIEQISQKVVEPNYNLEQGKLVIDRGQSGYEINKEDLAAMVLEHLTKGAKDTIDYEAEIVEPQPVDVEAIHSEVAAEKKNAFLDLSTDPSGNTISPSQSGADFDVAEAQQLLDGTEERYVEVPVQLLAPEVTTEDLKSKLFRDTLSSSTTKFNAGLKNRTTNVKLAASHINGTILNPGDVFSYNKTVGPRTYANGFLDATVFANGGAEDGVGGGICQVSSTLYVAALHADLSIVERKNHSLYVSYVPLGQDATVAYGAIDFRFENNTDYPIKIVAGTKGSSLTISLLGTKTQNKKVEIATSTLSSDPFQVVYQDDPTLQPGATKVKSGGYPGYKTQSYRVVYVDGKEVSRTLENTSTYKRLDKVILQGPALPEEPSTPTVNPDTPPVDPPPTSPTPEVPNGDAGTEPADPNGEQTPATGEPAGGEGSTEQNP